MKKTLWAFLTLFFAVFISACGGGGGGGASDVVQPPPPPPPATHSISGEAMAGAQVSVSNVSGALSIRTADSTGAFVVADLPDGTYTVSVELSGYSFTPPSQNVSVNGADVAAVNFVATVIPPATYSVSGKITGGTSAGVTVTLSPGGISAVTDASGNFVLSGVVNGVYDVTPVLVGTTFTPTTLSVMVNGGDVSGVNFTTAVPTLATGKLLYPCPQAVCSMDLSTGAMTVLLGAQGSSPGTVVPARDGAKFGVLEIAEPTISMYSLPGIVSLGSKGLFSYNADCSSWVEDGNFDLSPSGDFAVVTSPCRPVGLPWRTDIFLVKTDGSNAWVRVTDDVAIDASPVIAGVDPVTGFVTVLFVRDGTEIWKQVVDPARDVLVGPQVVVASSVLGYAMRPMSVNAANTHLAFVKKVGGLPHVVVVPLAGGVEVDLGVGLDPLWDVYGSNLVLYSNDAAFLFPDDKFDYVFLSDYAGATLWVTKPDGTERMSVPVPSNLQRGSYTGIARVVFAPSGN